jgi:hypothetical protein
LFYKDVPSDWNDIDIAYILSFIYSLDRTRPAYLLCIDAGKVDDFDYGLARQTLDQTLGASNPAITAAATKV